MVRAAYIATSAFPLFKPCLKPLLKPLQSKPSVWFASVMLPAPRHFAGCDSSVKDFQFRLPAHFSPYGFFKRTFHPAPSASDRQLITKPKCVNAQPSLIPCVKDNESEHISTMEFVQQYDGGYISPVWPGRRNPDYQMSTTVISTGNGCINFKCAFLPCPAVHAVANTIEQYRITGGNAATMAPTPQQTATLRGGGASY